MVFIDETEKEYSHAMRLATSIALPMVLSNVMKLKVLETIAEAGPAYEILDRLSISNDDAPGRLDQMLQLLASYEWILHGWSDDDCIKLLKNCYKALSDNGKVIIVEKIVSFLPDTSSFTKADTHLDAFMMTLTHGGKERTEEEFLALAIKSGFSGMKKKCLKCTFWVIEFYK